MRTRRFADRMGCLRTRPEMVAVIGVGLVFAWLPVSEAVITVADYNLLTFSSGSSSRFSSFQIVLSGMNPDILTVEEISNQSAVNTFRDSVLNAAGGPGGPIGDPNHYTAASFHETGSNLDLALFYREAKVTEVPGSFMFLSTSPRDTPRWQLRPVAEPSGANDIYVYAMHLHSSDLASRAAQAATVRANANTLPAGTHFFYAGDFNIDSSSEASYQSFIGSQADNDGRAFDPINTPGTWHNNAAITLIHTQSPHLDNPGAPGNAVPGGIDDRFDFLLISAALQDGQGLDYIPGTYRTFGNDGHHFNQDINDPPTIQEGAAMANALHAAADHLPVVLDLQDPVLTPLISAPPIVIFPNALVGGLSEATLTVTNTASPPAPDLQYSFAAPPGFMAPSGMFVDPAGGGGNAHVLTLLTGTSGNKVGILEIANNSSNNPALTVILSGGVLDHAVPSTVPVGQVLSAPLDFGTHPIGGFVDQNAAVYNAGVAANPFQALLEVHAVQLTGDTRFSVVGFVPSNVLDTPAVFTVHFDDTAAPPGVYTATLDFLTRDDTTLPGWLDLSPVTFNLAATIPSAFPQGDLNRSGAVDPADAPLFVALLLDPAAATPADRTLADMNGDTQNDGRDLAPFIAALVGP